MESKYCECCNKEMSLYRFYDDDKYCKFCRDHLAE